MFASSKINQPEAPVHPIPSPFSSVLEPLVRRSVERAGLLEDVAFEGGAMRPSSLVETIEEGSTLLSGDLALVTHRY
jgi:hypothetical protein